MFELLSSGSGGEIVHDCRQKEAGLAKFAAVPESSCSGLQTLRQAEDRVLAEARDPTLRASTALRERPETTSRAKPPLVPGNIAHLHPSVHACGPLQALVFPRLLLDILRPD
jgi:hypothetical protein